MKKLYTLLAFAMAVTTLQAQQIPNNGFENWVDVLGQEDPDGFIVFDAFAGSDNVTKSTDAHSGQFSARLSTVYMTPDTIVVTDSVGNPTDTLISDNSTVGQMIVGSVDFSTFDIVFGIPYAASPIKLRFWAKHSAAVVEDSSAVLAYLTKHSAGTDTSELIAVAGVALGGVNSTWTQYETDFIYLITNIPDSLVFQASSTITQAQGNVDLYIDDVELVYGGVSVVEVNTVSASLYPNPSNGNVNVVGTNGLVGCVLNVTDVAGRNITNTVITNEQTRLSINTPGLYFVTATNADGDVVLRKKVTVQ